MPKKKLFAFVKTETTTANKVFDLSIVICDRNGLVINMASALIGEHFEVDQPLGVPGITGAVSKRANAQRRSVYKKMLGKLCKTP